MRAIIWWINYAPEPIGIAPYLTGLAEHLQAQGIAVAVVTGFPYYPRWEKRPADYGQIYRTEILNGVSVHRCWHYVPEILSTLNRVLHEGSFVLTSFWRMLWLKRPDLYVVVSPPLGLGVAAALVSFLKRRPFLLQVQDLQPDSASQLGMVKPGLFLRLLQGCERLAYRHAAGVAGISAGMNTAFAAKGVPSGKIFLLPNWRCRVDGPVASPADAARFRQRHTVEDRAFLAVYSGNLGRKQGLELILETAQFLTQLPEESRPIVLLIAGDGAERENLAQRLRDKPLANVRMLPLQSAPDHAAMLRAADVALITQASGTGQVCFPSKLLSVLAAGRPVISAADETSDLARAVKSGGFGRNVPAGDVAALARTLRAAVRYPHLVENWTARTGWVERYSATAMLGRFESVIRLLGAGRFGARGQLVPLPGQNEV